MLAGEVLAREGRAEHPAHLFAGDWIGHAAEEFADQTKRRLGDLILAGCDDITPAIYAGERDGQSPYPFRAAARSSSAAMVLLNARACSGVSSCRPPREDHRPLRACSVARNN